MSDSGQRGSRHAQSPHSWASFTPEGVEDARRVRPAVSLEAFAAARALRYRGSIRWGFLLGVVPQWAERVFNACTGLLAPHRFGIVAHESLQVSFRTTENGASISGLGGDFHGERFRDPWVTASVILSPIPLDALKEHDGPFPRANVAVPTTVVALHVPEAATLPPFSVGTARRLHRDLPGTDAWGLRGFRVRGGLDDAQQAAILSGPVGQALAPLADRAFAELHVVMGQVRLTVDGYATDPGELDGLIARAVTIADGLAATEAPHRTPAPFAAPLPDAVAPVPVTHPTKFRIGRIQFGWGKPPADAPVATDLDGWGAGFAAAAAEFGLRSEDPIAFHRTFPRIPVPGTARGVLQGRLPSGIDGRLTVHLYEPGTGHGRSAVTFPARPGTPDTPPGGVGHEATAMRLAVADGLVTCWNRDLKPATIGTKDTSLRALETARALGYA